MALVDGSAELYARGEIGQDSVELLSKLVVRRSITAEFIGQVIIRQANTVEILGRGIIKDSGFAELFAKFEVGQDSGELLGKVDITHSVELLGRTKIRRVGIPIGLLSKGIIRNMGTPIELFGKFDAQAIKDLLGETTIRHPAYPIQLKGILSLGLTNTYLDLSVDGKIRHSGQIDLTTGFTTKQPSSQELLGALIASQSGYSDLLENVMIRNVGSRGLPCNFVTQGLADLNAKMRIGPERDSEVYLVCDDPASWINVVLGVGEGFIATPWVEADADVKKCGDSSARLTSTYVAGQHKEVKFGWQGKVRRDFRREVPEEGFKELAASFGLMAYHPVTYILFLSYWPWAKSVGTDWTTVLEWEWPVTQESSDAFLFTWDAQIRSWGPGAEYYVKMTLQHDGEAKRTLWMESGTNPAPPGWFWDGLAAGIFPISITRPWMIAVNESKEPFTVRIEMKSTQSIDVFWQLLSGVLHWVRYY